MREIITVTIVIIIIIVVVERVIRKGLRKQLKRKLWQFKSPQIMNNIIAQITYVFDYYYYSPIITNNITREKCPGDTKIVTVGLFIYY